MRFTILIVFFLFSHLSIADSDRKKSIDVKEGQSVEGYQTGIGSSGFIAGSRRRKTKNLYWIKEDFHQENQKTLNELGYKK